MGLTIAILFAALFVLVIFWMLSANHRRKVFLKAQMEREIRDQRIKDQAASEVLDSHKKQSA